MLQANPRHGKSRCSISNRRAQILIHAHLNPRQSRSIPTPANGRNLVDPVSPPTIAQCPGVGCTWSMAQARGMSRITMNVRLQWNPTQPVRKDPPEKGCCKNREVDKKWLSDGESRWGVSSSSGEDDFQDVWVIARLY